MKSSAKKMSPTMKTFKHPMKIEEITGQRILTSVREIDLSVATELFVKNFPTDAYEDELVPFFEQVGPLYCLRIMTLDKKSENRGYGYMTYINDNDAKNALNFLSGKKFRNRIISIELSMNNCRIFIGGIPVNKTKDQVWQELIRQKVENIVDVIMYRSYNNRSENRGFVFVEFPSHKMAARMRCRHKDLYLWGNRVIVDWSVPQPEVSDEIMSQVKIIYVRNLGVTETREDLKTVISHYIDLDEIDKIYKFKNYAFIHVSTRIQAQELLKDLKEHYINTNVEVMFAKPSSHLTQPEFRRQQMTKSSSIKDNQSLPDCSLSPIPHSSKGLPSHQTKDTKLKLAFKNMNLKEEPSDEARSKSGNRHKTFVTPVFTHTAATENWVNSSPFLHYSPTNVYAREAVPSLYTLFPNYYDINLLRTQRLMNQQRLGAYLQPPVHSIPGSYRLASQIPRGSGCGDEPMRSGRSRNSSVVSDLTECCPSDVLKEYHDMLDDAFNTNDK